MYRGEPPDTVEGSVYVRVGVDNDRWTRTPHVNQLDTARSYETHCEDGDGGEGDCRDQPQVALVPVDRTQHAAHHPDARTRRSVVGVAYARREEGAPTEGFCHGGELSRPGGTCPTRAD